MLIVLVCVICLAVNIAFTWVCHMFRERIIDDNDCGIIRLRLAQIIGLLIFLVFFTIAIWHQSFSYRFSQLLCSSVVLITVVHNCVRIKFSQYFLLFDKLRYKTTVTELFALGIIVYLLITTDMDLM